MSIAAIVPVWNGREWLARMLASLARQTRPVAHLIAVDNGSTDGAPDLARGAGALVISLGTNAGFAAAVNRGIEASARLPVKPQFIAVLNSDVELAPDYLEKLAALDAWFATGKLLAPSTKNIDGTFDATCRGGTSWRVGSGREDALIFSERRRIASVPFTAALFRAEIFRRVGLLDERFESYLEDVDFGLRCAARGGVDEVIGGIYEPAAVAWHKGSAALGRWHLQTVRRLARNQLYLLAKHYPSPLLRRWLRPILVAQLLWGGVALRHDAGAAWLRGFLQGIAGFRKMRRGGEPIDEHVLSLLLASNDRLIREYQCSTGYDSYWRWYFRLAGEA